MHIGTIELETGAGLAPMAGVTDAAMRLLCREQGAAWAVSEMLSAKGWIYSQGKNRNAAELLARLPGEGVAGLQLFGREPEYVGRAARELEDAGFAFIDLNFGCPAPKITGNGEGSALMREPERLAEVVAAAAAATRLPVTVKIRSGWDEDSVNAPEVALLCQQAGAQAVAVHARTRMQQYSGRADWSIIRQCEAGRDHSRAGQRRRALGRGRTAHDRRNGLRRRDRRPRGSGQSVDLRRNSRGAPGRKLDAAHGAAARGHGA